MDFESKNSSSSTRERKGSIFVAALAGVLLVAIIGGLIWWLLPDQNQTNSTATTNTPGNASARELTFIPNNPKPTVETQDFKDHFNSEYFHDDVADDAAIWANPNDPEKSLVIGNNKAIDTGGIAVFDMRGKRTHYERIASIGNVDLRNDFELGDEKITLVGANDQTNSTLVFWKLNPEAQTLERLETDGKLSTVSLNYGFCMYRSPDSGKYYGLVTKDDKGVAEQYEIKDVNGKIGTEKVRTLQLDKNQAEGCVFDDELQRLYVAVETGAIWQYGAEPNTGEKRTKIDDVDGKNLKKDVEGIAIAYGAGDDGYIVVSSQGSSSYAVYDRKSGKFEKSFKIGKNGDIDGVSETDGLDITTASLGPGFEHGALVVHDHANQGDKTSNLKYVPLVSAKK